MNARNHNFTETHSDPFWSLSPPFPGKSEIYLSDDIAELIATGLLTMKPNPYYDAGWTLVGLDAGDEYTFAIKDMRVGGRFARMDDLVAERRAERLLARILDAGGSAPLRKMMNMAERSGRPFVVIGETR